MGFGSYDESEQQNQDVDTDEESEGVTIEDAGHDGDVSFEADASTADLVDRLGDMKDDE
jgi:hypothetical protein